MWLNGFSHAVGVNRLSIWLINNIKPTIPSLSCKKMICVLEGIHLDFILYSKAIYFHTHSLFTTPSKEHGKHVTSIHIR